MQNEADYIPKIWYAGETMWRMNELTKRQTLDILVNEFIRLEMEFCMLGQSSLEAVLELR